MAEDSNTTWGTGTSGSEGSTGSGFGTSSSGAGDMGVGSSTGTAGFGVTSATDRGTGSEAGTCPHCGQSLRGNSGLEQLLGRLGITDEMINNLKTQFQNVEIDEYLNTARDYLKDSSGKATSYAKENPGKVAAGVAALALGAGLIYAATTRDKS